MSSSFTKIKRIVSDPVFWIVVFVIGLAIFLASIGIFDLTDLAD